ncbi:YaaL family protein [Bacillaceae bacterium Marseille-Q3522]|nr:YaaL family protein [Bacillaceae bacterium Marseille-Q3522]
MLFKRKGRLRTEYNNQLMEQITQAKDSWTNQQSLLNKCLDPSEEVVCETKLAEAKYLFLLKEAKARNVKRLR